MPSPFLNSKITLHRQVNFISYVQTFNQICVTLNPRHAAPGPLHKPFVGMDGWQGLCTRPLPHIKQTTPRELL